MRKLISILILMSIAGIALAGTITILLQNVASVGAGPSINFARMSPDIPIPNRAFQVVLNGASADSATVTLQGSNDNTNWLTLATFSPTSAVPDVGSQVVSTYAYMRGNLTAISGTGASVTMISGE